VRRALSLGAGNAQWLLAERAKRRRAVRRATAFRATARGAAGLLVAEGDSWFQYPFFNTLEALEDGYGYDIESVAHAGDTVESMAYDPGQLNGLARLLAKLKERERKPTAILLSGGGNDIAGAVLWTLLNHHGAPRRGFNEAIMGGVFDERLRLATITLIGAVTELHKFHFGNRPRILIHGYDYPVPDGRGYAGGFWVLPGPWLEPQFRGRGYEVLSESTDLMAALIDRFNRMMASVAAEPPLDHVRYVDLRRTLSRQLGGNAYRKMWANELHPTGDGFKRVAQKLHLAIANG
jgi:lysophospholipase L1-like esterase